MPSAVGLLVLLLGDLAGLELSVGDPVDQHRERRLVAEPLRRDAVGGAVVVHVADEVVHEPGEAVAALVGEVLVALGVRDQHARHGVEVRVALRRAVLGHELRGQEVEPGIEDAVVRPVGRRPVDDEDVAELGAVARGHLRQLRLRIVDDHRDVRGFYDRRDHQGRGLARSRRSRACERDGLDQTDVALVAPASQHAEGHAVFVELLDRLDPDLLALLHAADVGVDRPADVAPGLLEVLVGAHAVEHGRDEERGQERHRGRHEPR
jgi:hypothetical protein